MSESGDEEESERVGMPEEVEQPSESEESEESEGSEEDESTRKDREAGRQFGKVMIVIGSISGLVSLLNFDDQQMAAVGAALVVVGVIAYRWPVALVRLMTGQGDKL